MNKFLLLITISIFSNYSLNALGVDPDGWYYIQFVQSELVIEQQGAGRQLKATTITGTDKQLWRVETVGDYVSIINKEDSSLKINYDCNGTYIASTITEPGNELALTTVGSQLYALHRALYSRGNAVTENAGLIVRNENMSGTYFSDESVHIQLVEDQLPVNIADISVGSIKVYPNPATNFVYVETTDETTGISIVNIVGQTIRFINHTDKIQKVDISSFETGIYFVKVQTIDKTELFKIIVNN